jgi:diguanylate cyclase (GGDEF)-like protein
LSQSRKQALNGTPEEAAEPLAAEVADAVLEAHRHLGLVDQFRGLLARAVEWSGAPLGFVFGLGEERHTLLPIGATIPEGDPRFRALPKLDRERVLDWVRGGDGRFDGAGPLDAVMRHWPAEPIEACVFLPLVAADRQAAGALWLLFEQPAGPESVARIADFLQRVGPAIGNAVQVHAMRELVIKDDTARCFNRRYFEEFLPEEMSRASRFRAPLSLIFFDLDNLKQVNNDHGHAMGSRTLNEVSVRVRGKIRKFDKLFRFGGDEFCVVLPETEWHGALEVAERVRESIAGTPFLTDRTSAGPEGVAITASFGIASFPLHARDKESLVQEADRAMQKIKRDRKDGVGVAEIVGERHGS